MTDNTLNNKENRQLSLNAMQIFVAILIAFPMLATDMYLPAIPSIQENLDTTVQTVNLTLSVFFLIVSITTLVFGPLSDRYGRKPVLLPALCLFIISSFACAMSPSIHFMIIARVLQATGCGAGLAVSAAIVKDFFPPEKKEKAFAIIVALTGFVPAVAPTFGEQILRFTSWRGIFIFLSILGLVTLLFGMFFRETNNDLSDESIPSSLMNLFVVLKNPAFARLLILFSMAPLGMMAYVGISPTVYINGFGVSGQVYSIYFGANALMSVFAALAYIRIAQYIKPLKIISGSMILFMIGGVLLIFMGGSHPLLFLTSIAVSTIAFSLQRPPSMNLILEQQDKNTGSASALMTSLMGLLGSLGLFIISLEWNNRIIILGAINILLGAISFLFWQHAKKNCRIPANMKT